MIAGIMTTPTRPEYLLPLVERIYPSVEKLIICTHTPAIGTFWDQCVRTWTECLAVAQPGEPVLMLNDDMICPWDWRERWEAIHAEAQATHYSLFSRQMVLFTPLNVERGWVLTDHPNSWYETAQVLIDQPDWMPRVVGWWEARGKAQAPTNRELSMDTVVQRYINAIRLPYVVTTPSLFEHVGKRSVLKHAIGQSVLYVEDHERRLAETAASSEPVAR
jgi:hypothetical protein